MRVRRFIEELDARVDATSLAGKTLRKVFPDRWSYLLGEVALYSFVLLVLTGTFLTFFYVASSDEVVYAGPYEPLQGETISAAYASVLRLSFEVRAGLVMRQIHHWAALVFMAAVVLHLLRVFFTGAFRRPRELTWLVGVGLLLLGIGAGFTGYSLPDDLLSGTGLRIAYSVALSIPVVGTWIAFLFFGGEFPAPELLPRLFVLHVMLIPAAIVGLLTLHLLLVWRQTHAQHRAPGRTEGTVTGVPLWPKFAMKSTGLAFLVFAVLAALGGLVQINPVWLYGPFLPYTASSPSQPDWYAGWLEGVLRLWPNWEFSAFGHTVGELFLPGVVLPGLVFTVLALWPFLEARVTGDRDWHHFLDRPRDAPARTGIGAAGVTFMTILTVAGSNDVLAKFLGIEVDSFNTLLRWASFVGPPAVGGATFLVCRDLSTRELRPVEAPPRMTVRWTADGGFEDLEHRETGEGRAP
jgi:ubiquinol-cytochrome c reductase cytochrome b subunit